MRYQTMPVTARHIVEAAYIGGALLPVFAASEAVSTYFLGDDPRAKWVSVFLSGAAFHLAAEYFGANSAFVEQRWMAGFVGLEDFSAHTTDDSFEASPLQCRMCQPSE